MPSTRKPGLACYLPSVRQPSGNSWRATPSSCRPTAAPRVAAIGLSAAVLIAAAACSTSAGSHGSTGGGKALTPRRALLAAALKTRQVTSATETLVATASGPQGQSTTKGTVLIRRKPTLEESGNLKVDLSGRTVGIKEVFVGQTFYFSSPLLTKSIKKPWVKVPLSGLKGTAGASLAQLFHSLQSDDFTNQAELLTVAKNAKAVGKQTVDGVSTTEYAGSLKAGAVIKALPVGARKALAPFLRTLGNSTIAYHAWIDGQHYLRKFAEVVHLNGETVHTTFNITGINQPVNITVPPASQTAQIPGL
jgi:hypothetical protein